MQQIRTKGHQEGERKLDLDGGTGCNKTRQEMGI